LDTWQRYQRYDTGIAEYEAYAKTARTPDHRAFAYLMVGGMYEQKADYPHALAAYREAEKAGAKKNDWLLGINEGIARVADRLHDKPTAIKYLKQAADLADKQKDPSARLMGDSYRIRVKELEGSGRANVF
jgi:tetratricopeptide (TPR) repeat protein